MWKLDDLTVFLTVANEKSFARAAERLDMPTSTVSRRVSELESALKIKLLERTSRRLRLTEQGNIIFQQSFPLLNTIRREVDSLAKKRQLLAGKITIAAPNYFGNNVLLPLLNRFLHEHREIELNVRLSYQVEDLIDDNIDLAVRVGPLKDSQFIAQYLFSSHNGLFASADYLSQCAPIKTPMDLLNHDVLIMPNQQSMLVFHDEAQTEHRVNVSSRIQCFDIQYAIGVATDGLAIACLPTRLNSKEKTDHSLVQVLSEFKLMPRREIYLVYPSRKHISPIVRQLINFLKTAL